MTSIDFIDIDVLLSEKVTETVVTTDHPVEEGTDPTDHVRIMPIRLVLECVLTNTPIPEADRSARGEAKIGSKTGYAQRTYERIRALKQGRAIIVQTPARRYEDMQVTEIARTRDSSLGTDTIQFTVQFKEIKIVSTESIQLERVTKPTSIPKTPTGLDKQSKQAPEQVSDQSEAVRIADSGKLGKLGGLARPK